MVFFVNEYDFKSVKLKNDNTVNNNYIFKIYKYKWL